MLARYLLRPALVHVNTLLMQQGLADPKWAPARTGARCLRCSGRT
ncbi:TnpA family transposase [Streptomyces sp. DSM 41269]|nr:TnpA family transposase [Streptomyces sp. DSM 41269]